MVPLAVELTGAGKCMPGLEVFGNRLVEKGVLRMARVVKFGFAC